MDVFPGESGGLYYRAAVGVVTQGPKVPVSVPGQSVVVRGPSASSFLSI